MPQMMHGLPPTVFLELLYTAVIVLSSFLIYFKTKEIYELSQHKGILFFRQTFLFFGIAYLLRFLLYLFQVIRLERSIVLWVVPLGFFLISYAGTMAILCLMYSVVWKRLKKGPLNNAIALHVIALFLSSFAFLTNNYFLLFVFQTVLFLVAVVISYRMYLRSKKRHFFSQIYMMYILLFLFWLLNILGVILPRFLLLGRVIIYVISIGLFLLILMEISKRIR